MGVLLDILCLYLLINRPLRPIHSIYSVGSLFGELGCGSWSKRVDLTTVMKKSDKAEDIVFWIGTWVGLSKEVVASTASSFITNIRDGIYSIKPKELAPFRNIDSCWSESGVIIKMRGDNMNAL